MIREFLLACKLITSTLLSLVDPQFLRLGKDEAQQPLLSLQTHVASAHTNDSVEALKELCLTVKHFADVCIVELQNDGRENEYCYPHFTRKKVRWEKEKRSP